jgi:hypothetical protein
MSDASSGVGRAQKSSEKRCRNEIVEELSRHIAIECFLAVATVVGGGGRE